MSLFRVAAFLSTDFNKNMSKLAEDKGIFYSNRVRLGNWYEATQLEEYKLNKFLQQMKGGNLMLAKFRIMQTNLLKPTIMTQSAGSISFGARVGLLAPHVPASEVSTEPNEGKTGLLLGGRISSSEIDYTQELIDGCKIVAIPNLSPVARCSFTLTSADYCDRKNEPLKFNQEFLLVLTSSLDKKPLYVRYDPNPIPGLSGVFPLHLSEHPVSNTRWRVLPVQKPNITRFEQEGEAITVNTDVVINHCATNVNMGINTRCWTIGFWGKVCTPLMKTCLDIYGRELPNNIWQIYTPIAS